MDVFKKKIRIRFSGLSGGFDKQILNILTEKYDVELSETPDYLFYSDNSSDYLNYDCVRVYYTAENLVPDFNICDYAIGFHYIDFGDRYIRFPIYLQGSYKGYQGDDYGADLLRAQNKHTAFDFSEKTEFCSFVYSNAEAAICRERMFNALSDYKTVNSGGRYLNNVGGPVPSKLDFQKKHKFVIAFENTSTPGYTTEKIVHAFSANAIPIYWGNPEIVKEFNPGSFINCHDFGLTEAGEPEVIARIVELIKQIDNDDELYLSYIRTPAFTEKNDVKRQQDDFESFLINIFDQNIESAYRRNRRYWGERYERKQKIGNKFYQMCRKLIPIRDFFKRLFFFKK